MPSLLALSESLALLSSGLFAGAALYISLVEHPARMLCGTTIALTQFAPSYKRATVMQASLAAFGTLAAIIAWLQGARTMAGRRPPPRRGNPLHRNGHPPHQQTPP